MLNISIISINCTLRVQLWPYVIAFQDIWNFVRISVDAKKILLLKLQNSLKRLTIRHFFVKILIESFRLPFVCSRSRLFVKKLLTCERPSKDVHNFACLFLQLAQTAVIAHRNLHYATRMLPLFPRFRVRCPIKFASSLLHSLGCSLDLLRWFDAASYSVCYPQRQLKATKTLVSISDKFLFYDYEMLENGWNVERRV